MGDTSWMPWRSRVEQRAELVALMKQGALPVGELAAAYGVARKTLYKWKARFDEGGLEALEDRSRAPKSRPNATSAETVDAIIALKQKFPHMGPKKLRALLLKQQRDGCVPAASTIGGILERVGLVEKTPSRPARQRHPSSDLRPVEAPNDTWCIDFKGDFTMGDGQTCYPLTLTDQFSRYLLEVRAFPATRTDLTWRACERLFEKHGLPRVIRCDGGVPFSGRGPGGLSKLAVWWVKLGIHHERVGRPQLNGQHERMHRTLKRQTLRPPAPTARAQQRIFDVFRAHFNNERPHEALAMAAPSALYVDSTRRLPSRLRSPDYPKHFALCEVDSKGRIRWKKRAVAITEVLGREPVGLEEVEDGVHRVTFGPVLLGYVVDREPELGLIYPGAKRLERLLPMSPVRM